METLIPAPRKATLDDLECDVHLWSKDLKEYAGTDLPELPHLAVEVRRALGVRTDDDCTFIGFSRGNDYGSPENGR